MFTYNERDLHRMPPPSRSHMPVKQFIADSNLLNEDNAKDNEADVALLRLPAPALRGTFAKAYSLLTRLVAQIGWDELLRRRSVVFVMEEEYRQQKDGQEPRSTNAVPSANETTAPAPETNGGAVAEASDKLGGLGITTTDDSGSMQSIPTIKISADGDEEKQKEGKDEEGDQSYSSERADESIQSVAVEPPPLEKPAVAQAGATHERTESAAVSAGAAPLVNGSAPEPDAGAGKASYSFSNKRLCERWLDNLFMVLYEDLRVYTIWRAEMAHYRTQNVPYQKTGMEWEILGELAQRLHHKEEAKEAYQKAVETRFSVKAYLGLLEMYTEQRDLRRALWTALKLTCYSHRWYMEGSFPGAVAKALFTLIRTEGLAKVSYTLVSMSPPQPILRLMQNVSA